MILENLIQYVSFSPKDQRFVTCLSDSDWNECWAQLWDSTSHRPIGKPLRHRDGVLHAVFSPDGSKIATASEDFTARIWDAVTGRLLTMPLRHEEKVHMIDFSPDGRWLLTASEDSAARLWDVETGEPLTPALINPAGLFHGRFYLDSFHILVGSYPTTNWCWEFTQDKRPIADWLGIAYLLSGSAWSSLQDDQSDPKARLEKLRTTWLRMKSKYPSEFSTNPGDIAAWHEQEARADENRGEWAAAIFHLGYFQSYTPQNPKVAPRLAKARLNLAATGH
jgi:hypothetical protein